MRAPTRIDPYDANDKVVSYKVKSVWIGHGFWAGLGSIFTGLLTTNSITHWWVEIETVNGWYNAQFWKPVLTLTKCQSRGEVTRVGKRAANCEYDSKNITCKFSSNNPRQCDMGDVVQFIYRYAEEMGPYNLISNNCQYFGEAFDRVIGHGLPIFIEFEFARNRCACGSPIFIEFDEFARNQCAACASRLAPHRSGWFSGPFQGWY